jgi:hypothetical protein
MAGKSKKGSRQKRYGSGFYALMTWENLVGLNFKIAFF